MDYKIVTKFIKDVSFEIPNVETFLFFEENIENYELKIDIISKPLKRGLVQVDLILKFHHEAETQRRAHMEIIFATIINIQGQLTDKEELKKILLIKVPTEIYPLAFEVFATLIEKSTLKNIKMKKKEVDFTALYKEKNYKS